MQTGQEIEVDEEYTDPAGKSRFYHSFKSPVFGFGGEVVGSQGILFDITERKRAEGDLDAERALIRCLLDNSPDHIYFKDLRSRFLKTSQKHAEQFQRLKCAEEVVGKSISTYGDVAHATPAFEEEQEIIRTGVPLIGKVQRKVAKDGRVSWALITKMPLRDKTGAIIGTFGVSKDITAMKEARAKLEAERELLRTLLDNAPDHIYFKDLQSRFLKNQ